jgi:hypothetical protein
MRRNTQEYKIRREKRVRQYGDPPTMSMFRGQAIHKEKRPPGSSGRSLQRLVATPGSRAGRLPGSQSRPPLGFFQHPAKLLPELLAGLESVHENPDRLQHVPVLLPAQRSLLRKSAQRPGRRTGGVRLDRLMGGFQVQGHEVTRAVRHGRLPDEIIGRGREIGSVRHLHSSVSRLSCVAPSSPSSHPAGSAVDALSGPRDPFSLTEMQRPCRDANDIFSDSYEIHCGFVVATPPHTVHQNVAD